MRTLVYLSLGTGPHVFENKFSIYSVYRHSGTDPDFRIVVYTDVPANFAELPVDIREVSQAEIVAWRGGTDGYFYRVKTCVLLDALDRFGGSVVLVDGDTWFVVSPRYIFDRIRAGHTCLHVREGRLLVERDAGRTKLLAYLKQGILRKNGHFDFSDDVMMWNSGIVGMHESDRSLLYDVLELMDSIWQNAPEFHFIEQFATGYIFERGSTVSEAYNLVFHYWPLYLRVPFRERLPSILAKEPGGEIRHRAKVLFQHRPRPRGFRRMKVAFRELLFGLGLRRSDVRTNG